VGAKTKLIGSKKPVAVRLHARFFLVAATGLQNTTHGIVDHIDGTSTEPSNPILSEEKGKEGFKMTVKHIKLKAKWKKDVREWKQGEAVAKQQIASSIPDSLFMKVHAKGTAYDIWTELGKHF
jgi:hypothetical protein